MSLNPIKSVEAFDEDIAVMSVKVKTFSVFPGAISIMIEVDHDYQDTALAWFSEVESSIAVARLKPETQKEI